MTSHRFALAIAATLAGSAAHAITVDGVRDAAYGTPTAHVTYAPGTPNSNFGAPTPFSDSVNYDIYLRSTDGFLYGYLQADNAGGVAPGSVGAFANLYFDLNPSVGNGSDLGFELSAGGQRAFIPGGAAPIPVGGISVVSTDAYSLEFAIPIADFTGPISGLSYPAGQTYETTQTLRLSQAFSYSVAGGALYGPNRLGAYDTGSVAAVPEPGTWALMVGGLGVVAAIARRRGPRAARGVAVDRIA